MGALPKTRVSKSRGNKRRAHHSLKPPNLVSCPRCHKPRLPHHVCPWCGYYRGIKVVEVEEEIG